MNLILKLISLILFSLIIVSCNSKTEEEVYSNSLEVNFEEQNALSKWLTNDDANWKITEENGVRELSLLRKGEFGKVRKPSSFAAIKGLDVTDFELTLDAKVLSDSTIVGRDAIIYFAFQDPMHFYYVHLSNDNHKYHNIIGIVDGKDRLPITEKFNDDSKKRFFDYNWHKVKVVRNLAKGSIKVYVDDMKNPIQNIIDKTLTHGSVGVGSFDDFGKFRNIKLKYNRK
ncbi:MAG: family 16 glycoside hydrolase [Bacteroidota bacterium]